MTAGTIGSRALSSMTLIYLGTKLYHKLNDKEVKIQRIMQTAAGTPLKCFNLLGKDISLG